MDFILIVSIAFTAGIAIGALGDSMYRRAMIGRIRNEFRRNLQLIMEQETSAQATSASTALPAVSSAGPFPGACKGRVLSVGANGYLMARNVLLQRGGYEVVSTSDVNSALRRCLAEQFDLILLGHALPAMQKRRLLREIKKTTQTPVLSLFDKPESIQTDLPADHYLDVVLESGALVYMVESILRSGAGQLSRAH